MIQKSKKATVLRKTSTSGYANKNKAVLPAGKIYIGASMTASGQQRRGLTSQEEDVYLSELLSSNVNDVTWAKDKLNYWENIHVKVPQEGIPMEIGFSYSIDDTTKQVAIAELAKKLKKEDGFKSDTELANFVEGINTRSGKPYVPEEVKYKFGRPTNLSNYVLYRYCLVASTVANDESDISASVNINFFLRDFAKEEAMRVALHQIKKSVKRAYLDVIDDNTKFENLLLALELPITPDMDVNTKEAKLEEFAEARPKDFLAIVSDKNLNYRAFISRLINAQILIKLPNSEIIKDNVDDKIIANTSTEMLAYVMNDINDVHIKELEARLKAIA